MKSLSVILKPNDLSSQQSSFLHCCPWYSVKTEGNYAQWEDFQLEIVSSCWGNVLCNLGMFLDMGSKKMGEWNCQRIQEVRLQLS